MQFILVVIQSEDAEAALAKLKPLNLPSVISIATSGGFLRQSNTTLSMLVNEDQVNEVLASLRSTCKRRTTYIPTHLEVSQQTSAVPVEVEIGGGTVFIGEVERLEGLNFVMSHQGLPLDPERLTMNLIIAIIRDSAANAVLDALVEKSFRATRIASTGAFWRQGNTTLIIGVEANKVEEVIATLKSACGSASTGGNHCMTFFVVNTTQYEQI